MWVWGGVPKLLFCFILFSLFLLGRTDDAEVIFSDAETLGLMVEDFAWIVAERAFAAANTPVGELPYSLLSPFPLPPSTHTPFFCCCLLVIGLTISGNGQVCLGLFFDEYRLCL